MNRKLILCICTGLLMIGLGVLQAATQFTGWLTDKQCAQAGKYVGADHQKHVTEGQAIVFVSETDKQMHPIANPDRVKNHIGQRVTISGTARTDGSLEVETVSSAN